MAAKKASHPSTAATQSDQRKDSCSNKPGLENVSEDDGDAVDEEELKHQLHLLKRKRRKLQNSFFSEDNLKVWVENTSHKDYCEMLPQNVFWYKPAAYDYENKDKKYVALNMRTMIKPDTDPGLNVSKSR